MAAKVHKSLRLENDLVERVEKQRSGNEPFSNVVERVLTVGCDTLENVARNEAVEHAKIQGEHGVAQLEHDENTRKIITLLETENARLVAEHEADREAIAEKDKQLAAALEKAHELADQAHVLIGMSQEAKQLPHGEGGEIVEVTPVPEKIGFWEWWKNYR